MPGEMVAIWKKNRDYQYDRNDNKNKYFVSGWKLTMQVREFSPIKESLRTWVSLLALNGVWGLFRPRALMHSWNNTRERAKNKTNQNLWSSPHTTTKLPLELTNLEGQQAFVYFRSLQTSLPVSTRCIGPPLVPCKVDKREFSVHLSLSSKNDLEYSVAAGRVSVGWSLPWCSRKNRIKK